MIKPNIHKCRQTLENQKSVPLFIRFKEDYLTPIAIFEKVKSLNPKFLLESAGEHQDGGRYSYIGLNTKGKSYDNLKDIESEMDTQVHYHELPPFYNGYLGYVGFSHANYQHKICTTENDKPIMMMQAKTIIIVDHFINEITLVHNINSMDEYNAGVNNLNKILDLIKYQPLHYEPIQVDKSLLIKSNMTKNQYEAMVTKAKDLIVEGDIFQVVLSQQFTADFEENPFDLYKLVRRENPSPYLSYIEFDGITTICSSPELLVKCKDNYVSTAPIAGTRPVKRDNKDHLRAKELLNDEKELAEHLMLVDLGRNDVGKVSKAGSVNVEAFCQVKKYAKVMHLVSSVKGALKDDYTSIDAFNAAFPAGTVSGAPKKRALEIIHDLEPTPRGLYAGSIFYLNHDSTLNSCIAIRTITIKDKKLSIQSGAGIVYDSVPENEYKETIHKAQALFDALSHLYKGGLTYDFNHR